MTRSRIALAVASLVAVAVLGGLLLSPCLVDGGDRTRPTSPAAFHVPPGLESPPAPPPAPDPALDARIVGWLRSGAARGDADALFQLAVRHLYGRGVAADFAEAVRLARRAAEQGHPGAHYTLGVLYAEGLGAEGLGAEGLGAEGLGAEGLGVEGLGVEGLGVEGLGVEGLGAEGDEAEAARWFRLAGASGYPAVQPALGVFYLDGIEVPGDPEAARRLRSAAKRGDAEAGFLLGGLLFHGDTRRPSEPAAAARWFRAAADQGHLRAQVGLGVLLRLGFVRDGSARGDRQFLGAARKGDPHAQFNLALMSYLGDGTLRRPAQALVWYRAAAWQGHPGAQAALGDLHTGGVELPDSPERIARWVRIAAELGRADAQVLLSALHTDGLGVVADAAHAARWARRAAWQGHPVAQARLALMHADGDGVARDLVLACAWLDVAARQGALLAGDTLAKLLARLGPASRAEAVALADRYWARHVAPFR